MGKGNSARIAMALVFVLSLHGTAAASQKTNSTDSLSLLRKGILQMSDSSGSAQDIAPLQWHSMFTNLPSDWVRFGEASWKSENILPFLVISGMTAALIVTDAQTYQASDKFYRSAQMPRTWSDVFVEIGDGRSQFGIAGALAIYGAAAGDQHALRSASRVTEAVIGSGLIVQVLKHITGRESPFVSTRPTGTWRFFPNQIDYHKHVPHYDAFPSGHLCTTFATVTVLANEYPDAAWIKPVGYAISGLVGIGMVNTGIHWYSDYPLALAIGYLFGNIVAPAGPPSANADRSHAEWKFAPVLLGDRFGVGLACVF